MLILHANATTLYMQSCLGLRGHGYMVCTYQSHLRQHLHDMDMKLELHM